MSAGPPRATFDVDLEWGGAGIAALAERCAHLVIVDVLSFTTCVERALARGAEVLPWRWRDDSAAAFARERGARLAVPRGRAGRDDLSLAPSTMGRLRAGERVVLPSPNGATLSVAAAGHDSVWAACLRNAAATAAHLARLGGSVGLVPAGERWPDGSLRPAVEDLLGAGALAARLPGSLSAEAGAAAAAFLALRETLPERLRTAPSGQELIARGYADDVRLASEVDVATTLCRLTAGVYEPVHTSEA